MAKYTIEYSCGHGNVTKELFGPNKDRERKIEWMQANMTCPECFKAAKREQDAKAPKVAGLALVPNLGVKLQIWVTGQIEENKAALYNLGFTWSEKATGMLGYFDAKAPTRILAKEHDCTSRQDAAAWVTSVSEKLATIGYRIESALGVLDPSWMSEEFSKLDAKAAAISAREEAVKADPRPASSPLRQRIATLEKQTGSNWNGKIYGRPGSFNFYVDNVRHGASDAEVAEREAINRKIDEWKGRHPEIK